MGQATDATSLRLFTTTQFNLLAETGMRNAEVRADELPSMNYPGLAGHGVNYPEVISGVARKDPSLQNFASDAFYLEYNGPGKRCTALALFDMDRASGICDDVRNCG